MKWSELPKEYQDLEKGFGGCVLKSPLDNENISLRFIWSTTPQKDKFWSDCHAAETIDQLPPIPKENKS